jgi:hypothetical protein
MSLLANFFNIRDIKSLSKTGRDILIAAKNRKYFFQAAPKLSQQEISRLKETYKEFYSMYPDSDELLTEIITTIDSKAVKQLGRPLNKNELNALKEELFRRLGTCKIN